MSCAERAEVEAPPEVEATPFEQAVGVAVDEHDLAERLQANGWRWRRRRRWQ